MAESHATVQIQTRRAEMGRPMPRRFSKTAWWRFARDRRRRYLLELPGPPTNEQAARIESLVHLEWSSLKCAAEGGLVGLREMREHRRLFERLLADHVRSLAPQRARKSKPAEHLAQRTAGRTTADILAGQ
jgi:hypothetical protein